MTSNPHSMIRRAAVLTAVLAAAVLGSSAVRAAAPARPQLEADMKNLERTIAAELGRVSTYLIYYDQLQRIDVAQGRLSAGDADARLRGKGQALYDNSFEDGELQQVLGQHRQAAAAWFARIEQAVAAPATRWPDDKSAPVYQAMARTLMASMRKEYDEGVAARADVGPVLERVAGIMAWTAGQKTLPAAANPFSGQHRRIVAAIPDDKFREMLVDIDRRPAAVPTSLPAAAPTGLPAASTGVRVIGQPGPVAMPNPPAAALPPGVMVQPLPPGPAAPNMPIPPAPVPLAPAAGGEAFQRAHEFYAAGRYIGAMPMYNAILQAPGAPRQALFERAVMRTWLNDLAGAQTDFATLASTDPNDLESRRLHAISELVGGDPRVGKAEADALLALQPANVPIVLVAAQAALYNGDPAAAQRLLAQIRQTAPGYDVTLYQEANRFLTAGVPAVALLQFTAMAWMVPERHEPYWGIGFAYSKLGQKARAIEAFERYLQTDQTSQYAQAARQELERLRQAR